MNKDEHKNNYFSLVYGLVLFIGGITSFLLFGVDTFNPKINFLDKTSGFGFIIFLLLGWIMLIYGILSFFNITNYNVFVRFFNKIFSKNKLHNDNKVAIVLSFFFVIILPILVIVIQPINFQKEFKKHKKILIC